MTGQLQFGGTIPFADKRNGGQVQVRVWGVYVGQGVDAHEESAIQQWIMNALASSALQYDGDVHELPQKAHEWGSWVSQQIAPGLAQNFQAQGQIQIQGVSIEGAGGAKPMSKPMGAAPAMRGGALDEAANALSQQLGIPPAQAMQAAQIVMQVLEVQGGGAAMKGVDPYAKKPDHGAPAYAHVQPDPYAQKKLDPYAQKKPDPYAKHVDHAKKPDPYAQKKPDPYAKQVDPHAKKPDPYAKHADPSKHADPYGKKGEPWKK